MNRLQEFVNLDRSVRQLFTTSLVSVTTNNTESANKSTNSAAVTPTPSGTSDDLSTTLNPLLPFSRTSPSPSVFNLTQLINDSLAIFSDELKTATSTSVFPDKFGHIFDLSSSGSNWTSPSTPTTPTSTALFTVSASTFTSLLPTVFQIATNSTNFYDANGDHATLQNFVLSNSNSSSSDSTTNFFSPLSPLGGSTGGQSNSSVNDSATTTIILEPDFRIHHPVLALLLGLICVVVVFGNALTMVSIYRERYLHTVTNYFVASLAAADCLVGAIVMPFSVVHEVMNKWWIFGQDWCDLWHSFDVLASSASILNLCVISLDRYWAITDPITYPSRMTPNKASLFIFCLWFCSSLISFPAIVWWRAVQKEPVQPYRCFFTDDMGYLVFSSTISFYGPLTIMVFTYYRIYVVASKQTRSLKLGVKQIEMSNLGDGGGSGFASDKYQSGFALRMHRGGGAGHCQLNSLHQAPPHPSQHYSRSPNRPLTQDSVHYHSHGQLNTFQVHHHPPAQNNHQPSCAAKIRSSLQTVTGVNRLYKLKSADSATMQQQSSVETDSGSPSIHSIAAGMQPNRQPCSPASSPESDAGGDQCPIPTVMDSQSGYGHPSHSHPHNQHRSQRNLTNLNDNCRTNAGNGTVNCGTLASNNNNNNNNSSSSKTTCSAASANFRHNHKANWSVGRRLAKLAKERKAAKTLGIVMGVFILCWLPFFVTNVLMGICPESCILEPDLVLSVVTWLGWINSAMNPIIYACWSKDFRRAFRKILCSCFISNQNLSYNRNRIYKAAHNRCNYYYKSKINNNNRINNNNVNNNNNDSGLVSSVKPPNALARSTTNERLLTAAASANATTTNTVESEPSVNENVNERHDKSSSDNNNNRNTFNDNDDDVNNVS